MEPNQEGVTFNIVHIHPLFKGGKLKGPCAVCEKIDPIEEECYTCTKCNFYFCYPCSNRLSPEILKSLHIHPMVPTDRPHWRCDLCRTSYLSGVSMYCSACDFDVCCDCFWDVKSREIHVH